MSDADTRPKHDVVARREGALGHLTLNRPAAYNALTIDMVRTVDAALDLWEHDPQVAVLLLDGAGDKAFCAGGDIRALYEAARAGLRGPIAEFFRLEYRLNARIARFPKPIVTVMHGMTMGGGIGLGAHASHRVVTERSTLAMPEVRIGFAPDVGGTHLLARAPGELGLHLALTGGRLGPADALICGLADAHVPSERLHEIRLALARCRTAADVEAALREVATAPAPGPLAAARGWIDRCYGFDAVEDIVDALEAAPEPDARAAAAEIAGNAPTSLKVTLQALRDARLLDLEDCLDREFRVSLAITARPDFVEGVRAAVVDKDRAPRWRPVRLSDVGRRDVLRHFEPVAGGELGLGTGA
ncbi:enoyl-CoA hydratase/isomerase family protein [Lichenibacterium dinghuense]|uniref:enoyl-CoA hydratase/isomerase family protein n=1 Tax=Lichenibacterium dinghuense TaxID=2895977 RepID=UPI001F2CEB0E|nr:enoyl-CoA hydratase/isomerase family protein [Lichenibacterium sp. 6Y81]